jgi:hypothetical protein
MEQLFRIFSLKNALTLLAWLSGIVLSEMVILAVQASTIAIKCVSLVVPTLQL